VWELGGKERGDNGGRNPEKKELSMRRAGMLKKGWQECLLGRKDRRGTDNHTKKGGVERSRTEDETPSRDNDRNSPEKMHQGTEGGNKKASAWATGHSRTSKNKGRLEQAKRAVDERGEGQIRRFDARKNFKT